MIKDWKSKKLNLSTTVIVSVITAVFGVVIGANWSTISSQFAPYLGFQTTTVQDWSALDEVYSALTNNYDGEIDRSVLVEGAKKGLTDAIGDVYTVYMTPEETAEFSDYLHGEVGAGIGVEMGLRDGYVRIIRTLPDNPARKAGMLAGDIFYKVNGEEVYTLSNEEIANKLRGEVGTEVTVSIIRDGEEKTFTMTREEINNVSAYVEYKGSTAILKISRFDNDTGTLAAEIAAEFKDKGVNKVILDLRGNGGGYVTAAQDLLSLWLDGDAIMTQKSVHTADNTMYAKRGKAILANMKTIVLINGTSASASEIVAGALKDYEKATLVGETTYGKGVVQTLLDLSAGSTLKVTTAHWFTPKDNTINKTGIAPDISVENTYDDTNAGRDPQLTKALSL